MNKAKVLRIILGVNFIILVFTLIGTNVELKNCAIAIETFIIIALFIEYINKYVECINLKRSKKNEEQVVPKMTSLEKVRYENYIFTLEKYYWSRRLTSQGIELIDLRNKSKQESLVLKIKNILQFNTDKISTNQEWIFYYDYIKRLKSDYDQIKKHENSLNIKEYDALSRKYNQAKKRLNK